jgi:hypothetical protein
VLAHDATGLLDARCGRDAEEIEALRATERLDRERIARVAHDHREFQRRVDAHAHVILHAGGCRHRLDRRGERAQAVLRHQGGTRVLRDHEAGVRARGGTEERRQATGMSVREAIDARLADVGKLRHRDRREIERDRDGLSVEVPPAHDATLFHEDQRVVGHGIDLGLQDASGVVERIARRAVHLGHAADRVRILYTCVANAVRGDVRAPLHE